MDQKFIWEPPVKIVKHVNVIVLKSIAGDSFKTLIQIAKESRSHLDVVYLPPSNKIANVLIDLSSIINLPRIISKTRFVCFLLRSSSSSWRGQRRAIFLLLQFSTSRNFSSTFAFDGNLTKKSRWDGIMKKWEILKIGTARKKSNGIEMVYVDIKQHETLGCTFVLEVDLNFERPLTHWLIFSCIENYLKRNK